ncbi:hypothetical protein IVB30_14740 [Bradyrhizobium sp. 200]|uniref:hypothetical protein n=1 Tax=Bradyrhizobium sp. 200 TaxID=2782665 RepID=UPI001FFFF081|nr:hypothetical protein [Bradyrhizobium sp. 200]UPJ52490.1 hypothetical protein IVB30_14740 [Bradyrhizobium sp. 200]
MEAILEENSVDPELLQRLGKIVILWASVESWIAFLLGTLMNADLGASGYLTNNVSSALQIKCIRALLSVHAHKEPATKGVIDLLDRADELRSERNELVHGLWHTMGCAPKTALVNTTNLDRAEIIRDRLITVSDLDQLVDDIETWVKDYATLGARIGFPRNRGVPASLFVDQP